MPFKLPLSPRFSVLFHFAGWFLLVSFLWRLLFFAWQYDEVSWNIFSFLGTLFTGLFFDLGTLVFLCLPGVWYYALLPNKWIGSYTDRFAVWFFTALTVFLLVFVFFAELTFWNEFRTRFNFIAVDYLIYTHEVVANIRESYPLPLLVGGVLFCTVAVLFLFYKRGAFRAAFSSGVGLGHRIRLLCGTSLVAIFYIALVRNDQAEWSVNRYNDEISKAGIYSFFAAFRNNQMKYTDFYTTIANDKAFKIVRKKLSHEGTSFTGQGYAIHKSVSAANPRNAKPNVVFVLVESLSGSFLKTFGNQQYLTPFLDSLAQQSLFFRNMYATGTRTVRGMEAVTLCIPPTPGQSIVKRPENHNLYTIASVFRNRLYDCNFFYGGDGYFDNMNSYFGGNGFDIYDRGRGSVLSDAIKTKRYNIEDSEVTFENAWGVCDEDLFKKMISVADAQHAKGKPFLNFVMTTSNHRPFTFPAGKVPIPSGLNREGAVQYTDYALRQLFEMAKRKPWYKNTVFVVVADHCASSAGKDEIDVANYHIPALIVNLPNAAPQQIEPLCSQIDLWPTLFARLNWNYESDFFGQDVLAPDYEPRALLGTYRKLALMKGRQVMILSDQKKQNFYDWDAVGRNLTPKPIDRGFLDETIAWYQTADYLFTNKLLK